MDVLNTLSMLYSNTTLHLSILSKTLDPVSTAMMGMHGEGVFGESVVPTITFGEYLARGASNGTNDADDDDDDEEDCEDGAGGHAVAKRNKKRQNETNEGEIEVLIVPGGGGTRQNMTEEIAFVKELYPKVSHVSPLILQSTTH